MGYNWTHCHWPIPLQFMRFFNLPLLSGKGRNLVVHMTYITKVNTANPTRESLKTMIGKDESLSQILINNNYWALSGAVYYHIGPSTLSLSTKRHLGNFYKKVCKSSRRVILRRQISLDFQCR